MTIKEALSYFRNQSLFCSNVEICGLLGEKNGDYTPRIVKNKHSDPHNNFAIDPLEYLRFSHEFNLISVFHTHVIGDSSPSDFDKVNSENTLIPFLIYSLPEKKFGLFEPSGHECKISLLKEAIL